MTLPQTQEAKLERRMDVMQKELKGISESLAVLIANMNNHVNTSQRNAQDIKELNVRVDELDRKEARQDGGVKTFKAIVGFFSAAIIASCGWLFSSIQNLEKENVSLRTELQHVQIDIDALEHKVGR